MKIFYTIVIGLFLLVIAIILLTSCSKEEIKPVSKSITYLHKVFDLNNNYVRTDTAYHECEVYGEDLARYESYPKEEAYCDSNDILYLVFAERCLVDCFKWDGIPDSIK